MKTLARVVMFTALFAAGAGCVSEPAPEDRSEIDPAVEPTSSTSEDLSVSPRLFRCVEPDFTCTTARRCGSPPGNLPSESCGPNLYCCFIP